CRQPARRRRPAAGPARTRSGSPTRPPRSAAGRAAVPAPERRATVITIPRALARQFRAVLRKAHPPGAGRGSRPLVLLQAGPGGPVLRPPAAEVAPAYPQAGPRPGERPCPPGGGLGGVQGRPGEVALERAGPEAVQARWDDRGVPQVRSYAAPAAE